MARESIEGQAIELGWRRDNALRLGDADYLEMVLKKTCWYTTIYPSRVGALIGTRGDCDLDRFVRFGFFLGAAFQIQDDLLNLEGDPLRYGKELDGDLWEGKRTLMLIHLLRKAGGPGGAPPARVPRRAPRGPTLRRRRLGARANERVRLPRLRSPGGARPRGRGPARGRSVVCRPAGLA